MKRIGYQIYRKGGVNFSYWKPHGPIYMSKKEAERHMSALSFLCMGVKEVEVVESEDSIDNFYSQIEMENPEFQEELEKALEDFKRELANTRFISEEEKEFHNEDGSLKPERIRDWLRYLSDKALVLNKLF